MSSLTNPSPVPRKFKYLSLHSFQFALLFAISTVALVIPFGSIQGGAIAVGLCGLAAGLAQVHRKPEESLLRPKLFAYYAPTIGAIGLVSLPPSRWTEIAYLGVLLGSIHSYCGLGYLRQYFSMRIPATIPFVSSIIGILAFVGISVSRPTEIFTSSYWICIALTPAAFHLSTIGFMLHKEKGHRKIVLEQITLISGSAILSSVYAFTNPGSISAIFVCLALMFAFDTFNNIFGANEKLSKANKAKASKLKKSLTNKNSKNETYFTAEKLIELLKSNAGDKDISFDVPDSYPMIKSQLAVLNTVLSRIVNAPNYHDLKFKLHFYTNLKMGMKCQAIDIRGFVDHENESYRFIHLSKKQNKELCEDMKEISGHFVNKSMASSPPLFTVYVPCSTMLEGTPGAVLGYSLDGSPKEILIIDDDADIVDLFKDYLEDLDVNILTASDGKTALELFDKHRPDCVITDLLLPKLSGLELIEEIRKKDEYAKVISVSGTPDKDMMVAAIALGSKSAHAKPPNMQHLIAEVREAVGSFGNKQ
ncbi:MAG: response regulator [Pseudobacteriovorax sp.]|nr:response regulator [Pseudobacteriovorax sp.]